MSVSTTPTRTSSLSDYRDLPAITGRAFLPISLLARLPMAMTPLAILTFVASTTGDFTQAGIAATATAAGTAAGAPAMGVLAGRFGQRVVLGSAVLINALALVVLACWGSASGGQRMGLCVAIGMSMPQVGGMARARWLALTRSRLSAAFAFEGTADEMSFVLGPALAGLIAGAAGASGALLVAAGLTVTAAGAFALHPTHAAPLCAQPASEPVHLAGSAGPGRTRHLLRSAAGPVASMAGMGMFFAATQSGLTAFAVSSGRPSGGGLLYALMAAGSALTALLMPALPSRIGVRARMLASSGGLVTGAVLICAGVSTGTLAVGVAVLFTGLWVGPLLLTVNSIVAAAVRPDQGATAMALLTAGLVCGVGVGALMSGSAADRFGPQGALLVAATAALGLLLGAALMREPVTPGN